MNKCSKPLCNIYCPNVELGHKKTGEAKLIKGNARDHEDDTQYDLGYCTEPRGYAGA